MKQLANIPPQEVLLAQLCGLLMSPISRTAVVLGALAAKKAGGACCCLIAVHGKHVNQLFRKSKWHSIKTHF